MTLNDQIIDEAEELARNRVLAPYATRAEIAEIISEIVNVNLAENSVGAYLAEAAHNRILWAHEQMDEAVGVVT
jgi:hypothetical protein